MAVGDIITNPYTYTNTSTGQTITINPASSGGYMQAYQQYEADRTAQLDANRAALQKTLQQNNATTNANYDNSARQAYVDYMRKQKTLPSQLQALGVNGGATESGLLNLYNNYGSSHAANEQQRNADLTKNQNAYDDAYNAAYQAYLSDLNEQKQQAISNQINQYDNEITQFSASVAQYPTTDKGYKAYETWINNLAASNDPLKDIKIGLIRQQMATQFPNGTKGLSSSKSSSSKKSNSKKNNKKNNKNNNKDGNTPTVTQGNSVGQYYSKGNGGNNARNTKNIKGDKYYVTSAGSYRSR